METIRKERRNAPPGFFAIEAAGLRWLSEPNAVHVARVVDVGDDFIELERLQTASPTATHADDFGRSLAALHDAGADAFGCPPAGWHLAPEAGQRGTGGSGYVGDAPLPHGAYTTWGVFYANLRVLPYARQAHEQGTLSTAGLRQMERLSELLAAGRFDDPAGPARIHGDLWSGNVLWTPDGVGLIDPAAHGGHRITDLAMLALFGAPLLDRILNAYAEASAHLPEGWRTLLPLHQVHPLLVHAVLFGGGYGEQAEDAAARSLALAG